MDGSTISESSLESLQVGLCVSFYFSLYRNNVLVDRMRINVPYRSQLEIQHGRGRLDDTWTDARCLKSHLTQMKL